MDPRTPAPPCIAQLRSPWRWTRGCVWWPHGARPEDGDGELRAALDDAAGRLASQGLDARTELVEGDPVTALLDVAAAERASLVVVGPSARKLTLGSVSHALATRAHCDVLIVRAEQGDAP